MPIIAVNYKDKDFLLSLTGESSIDMARQKLVLVPGETGETSLSFAPASGGTKDSFRQWYANQGSVTTADVLEKKTADYITGSYEGWKSGRYTPEEGVWLNEKGTKTFSEELVTAYIAESLRRAGSGAVLEEMQKIASMHADMLGFKSSVFFGNLQNLSLRLLRDDEKESARIGALIRSRDSSVFARGDLIQFAADRGSPNLKAEVLKFASEVDLSGLSLTTALGMLRNYYDEKTLDPAVLKTLERFVPLINAKIFPAIIKINEGFFLEIGNGKIDVYLSILGGRILMLAGKAERDPVLEAIGRDLILSSLSLADKQGFLPRNILFSEMTLRGNEGRIAPEDVYPLIVDNPYYPRFISLSKDLGRQAWLYTAANMTSLSFSKERYVIRFRFPEGATHHFIFRGAKPYKEIQIWGIPWRVDSRFERYSTGSYFLENEGIFAVKYRHKKTEEEFLMGFSGE
jgi:hypothetical protein